MAVIPTNYPTSSSNEEILQVVNDLAQEMITGGANINTVMQFSPLIAIGQAELQKRLADENSKTTGELHKEVTRLNKITQQYSKSSELFANASRRISVIALVVAVATLIFSVYLGVMADNSNKQWHDDQLKVLQQIKENTTK